MPDIPRSRTWLLLAGTIVLQIAIIRSATVLKRGLDYGGAGTGSAGAGVYARNLSSSPDTAISLSLPYSDWYASSPAIAKPLVALGYLLLLSFLFSFIGIVASDFFCPNLATIANYLGLSETTAGVTFLAFGNGSPDVFSTFSAMNQGTFSLAIGELLGAATFITSIVVGSIAFIRPFYVPKTAFIRDISFFTAAVVVMVTVLRDGHLTLLESTAMVALYALYVIVVVVMNVLAKRRKRLDLAKVETGWKALPGSVSPFATSTSTPQTRATGGAGAAAAGQMDRPTSLHLPSPHLEQPPTPTPDDQGSTGSLTPTAFPRRRSRSHSQWQLHQHQQQHGLSTPDYAETPRANFSLLGAVEFRDVVNSLKRESVSVSRTPSPSRSPYTAVDRSDYFSQIPGGSGSGSGQGHRRSISTAATVGRRTSVQYRSRAISHVVHPGSMATFSMTPSDVAPPPSATRANTGMSPSKRMSPVRTTSSPAHSPGYGHGHGHGHGHGSKVGPSPMSASPENPWKDQSGNPPSSTTSPRPTHPPPRPSLPKLNIPEPILPPNPNPNPKRRHGATPSISVMDPSGHVEEPVFSPPTANAEADSDGDGSSTITESRFRIRRRARFILRVLFPSLQSFRHKSLIGKFLSVFSVPAIFALTLTLPVVDDGGRDEEGKIVLPEMADEPLLPDLEPGFSLQPPDEQQYDEDLQEQEEEEEGEEEDPFLRPEVGEGLHHLVEGGFSPLHSPLGRIRRVSQAVLHEGMDQEDAGEMSKELLDELQQEEAMEWNKPLCAAQCVFGPAFCAYIVFGDFDYGLWVVLAAALSGAVVAAAVTYFGTDGTSRPWRMVRCMAGFTCSMVWIAAIADEVVSVLQSIGELMGLSDAIIGLTIFAIGNSMADLVANITVAQFAPAMAYAACFGGPMLNLLLGVGGSGTYHLLVHPHHPVNLHFSPTLWVSATGLIIILLTTAVVVPLNGYLIDRRWATCLVVAYATLMVANVAVEIKTGRA